MNRFYYVNNNYQDWNYNGSEHGWRGHYLQHFNSREGMTTFCVVETENRCMPEPALDMLRSIKNGWAKDVKIMKTPYTGKIVYPIAYIDGTLYFTNNVENMALNDSWGNKTLYCARIDSIDGSAKPVDCDYKDSTKVFILSGGDNVHMLTNELGEVIQKHTNGIIENFIEYCRGCKCDLKITYQDEHLKSVMGMILTLQTIEYFVKQIGKDFTLEFLLEKYEDYNYKGTIMANLKNYAERDMRLNDLCEGWLAQLDSSNDIQGSLKTVISKNPQTLTHWRVLSIECGNKRLCIYPDGGFANGWNLSHEKNANTKFYTLENTDTTDNIALERSQDIKFDVNVEDIED